MNEIKPDLEGLEEPIAFAKVTNDALKFCDSDLVSLVHPIVEYRYHTGVGISEGADFNGFARVSPFLSLRRSVTMVNERKRHKHGDRLCRRRGPRTQGLLMGFYFGPTVF